MAYAHSRNDQGWRHDLVEHLTTVAETARTFAAAFDAGDEVAYWAGLWHDLGKFNPAWQSYLADCETGTFRGGPKPDHKAAGAKMASQHLPPSALLIQGHHGGLTSPESFRGWIADKGAAPGVEKCLDLARRSLPQLEPSAPIELPPHVAKDPRAAEFFLRMVFSALVDADYLDTERHFQPEKASRRPIETGIEQLWEIFERNQKTVTGQNDDQVSRVRHQVYQACLDAAEAPPGLFRLTVPTGGGKTRSGLAFALRHAMRHGHRRIVMAVPFISITEQTAKTYRDIFGAGEDGQSPVLEHHSGVAHRDSEGDDFRQPNVWQRLAAENWDAPLIVTTTVQLFESLFSNSTSKTRKLHRLARSVIVLDEAQALPPHLLEPILDTLQELIRHYGATVVISTATQPAFDAIRVFAETEAREIVPDPKRHFRALDRVDYEWRTDAEMSWPEIADLLRESDSGLAIMNTKSDAMALLDALDDPEALHLSTLLCGAHRSAVIDEVKSRLDEGTPCRLVSTQVIEAGVDLDFPVVIRAIGPLDSIIQSAGRCNREGKLDKGRVIIVRPADGGLPLGAYRAGTQLTESLTGGDVDPNDPDLCRTYFERLFDTINLDRDHIQKARERLDFAAVAADFQMIDDDTEGVVIGDYGSTTDRRKVVGLVDRLRRGTPDGRNLVRQLQPYILSLRRRAAQRYRNDGLIEPITDGLSLWKGGYDATRGIVASGLDPDPLVI